MLNEEREYKQLKNVILEELGISEEVKNLAFSLTEKIMKEYTPGYTVSVVPFDKKCGEYTVYFDFTDYPKESLIPPGPREYKGITYFSYRKVIIYGFTVRGRIYKDLLNEVLQHEFKHIFDLYKSRREGFFKAANGMEIYATAARQATNLNLPIEARAVGYAIYLSHKFETQAFESGTYAYLMKRDLRFIGDEVEAVKSSMFYERLIYVRTAYDFVTQNPGAAEKIAKSVYGKTLNWLKKTVTATLKMCRRQIGRAVAKVRKDYDWTHGGQSLISV